MFQVFPTRRSTTTPALPPRGVTLPRDGAPGPSTAAPPIVGEVLRSPGRPLDAGSRGYMESRFGHDFSRVRIHADTRAAESAQAVGALAYTAGRSIVFNRGRFSPGSAEGRRLLAHELAHTIQQGQAAHIQPDSLAIGSAQDASEQDAERAASDVTAARTPRLSRTPGLRLARQADAPASPTPAPAPSSPAPAKPPSAAQQPLCSLTQCVGNQPDIVRADFRRGIAYVKAAIAAVNASPLAGPTQRALDWYFNSHDAASLKTVRKIFDCILAAMEDTLTNDRFGCDPDYSGPWAAYVDSSDTPCVDSKVAICFASAHWSDDPQTRARSTIHECAHRVGMSPSQEQDFYWHTLRFRFLDASEALMNSDSYSRFAVSITDGVPVTVPMTIRATGGTAESKQGASTWYASLHFEGEIQHPRFRIFNPILGIGMNLIGESTTGGTAPVQSNSSLLYSLLGGVRIADPRPGEKGGAYLSLFGGPAVDMKNFNLGAEVGVSGGYRWKRFGIEANLGYVYAPGRESGMQHVGTAGISVTFTPQLFVFGGG